MGTQELGWMGSAAGAAPQVFGAVVVTRPAHGAAGPGTAALATTAPEVIAVRLEPRAG